MERETFVDNLKGWAIFCVVAGHIGEANIEHCRGLVDFIYSFHMPLFFMISGYLHKYKNYYALKSAVSLLVPYVTFAFVSSALNDFDFQRFFLSKTRGGLWFLPTLYLAQIIWDTIYKISYNRKIILIVICVLVQFIAILSLSLLSSKIIDITLIRHLCTYWMFFVMGGFVKKLNYSFDDIMGCASFLIFMFGLYLKIKIGINTEFTRQIIRIFGVITFWGLFKKLKSQTFLEYIGKNSLYIYILHFYLLFGLEGCAQLASTFNNLLIVGVESALICIVCSYLGILTSNNKYLNLLLWGKSFRNYHV